MNRPTNHDASVIVPVLNAGRLLPGLLTAIFSQKPCPPREVILVDSGTGADTAEIARSYPNTRVVPIRDFSHGRSRNLGVRQAEGTIAVFLTQDALPADEHWLAALLQPFADDRVTATFSRQLLKPEATPMERFALEMDFPASVPVTYSLPKGSFMPPEYVSFSNVSSATRREFLLTNPFDERLIMSEDLRLAREVLEGGHLIVYQPESCVIHSHRHSLRQTFGRSFDGSHVLTQIFPNRQRGLHPASVGHRFAAEGRYLARHAPAWLPYFILHALARNAGAFLGRFAERLPRWLARRCSFHPDYWSAR